MQKKVHNPHDIFFKIVFSIYEIYLDFFINYLLPDIFDLLDISTIELAKDSFVDKNL
jgi:predicted transposase YdaD